MTEEQLLNIKGKNNIIDVAVRLGLSIKEKGGTQAIRCFAHEDNNPSCVFMHDVGRFECKGCGVKGDTFDLVQLVKKCTFQDAVMWVDPTVTFKKNEQIKMTPESYLKSRGLTRETLEKFNVRPGKYNNKDVVIIPTPNGNKYRRMVQVGDKFIQDKGTAGALFKTKDAKKRVILVEGELDAIKMWQETGYATWSGTSGAGTFNEKWLSDFKDIEKIYICYDNDEAGRKGVERVVSVLGVDRCYYVQLPSEVKDVTEYFQLFTPTKEQVDELLKNAIPSKKTIKSIFEEASKSSYVITTGIDEIDNFVSFTSGNAYMIAGAEKTGKSALCFQIMNNVLKHDIPVSYCNTELTIKEFYERVIGNKLDKEYASINVDDVQEWSDMYEKYFYYSGIGDPLSMIDGVIHFKSIMTRIEASVDRGAKVVFFDNVSTFADMADPESGREGWQVMNWCMTKLKEIAKNKGVIVFVVNHAKDAGVEREQMSKVKDMVKDKNPRKIFEDSITVMQKPTNASLYGGMRAIGQFSGTILVWRPWQKFSDSEFNKWSLIILESFRSSRPAVEFQAIFRGEIPSFEPHREEVISYWNHD